LLEKQINEPNEAEKFRDRLKCNMVNSTTIDLDDKIKTIVIRILKGELSAKQAEKEYHIDRETIRRKINQFVQEDESLLVEYIEYLKKSGEDYSGINFKGLIISMIKQNLSQSQMAKRYKIPARTISRELEKLSQSKDEKDSKLYKIAKNYSRKKMLRERIPESEIELYATTLDEMFGEIEVVRIDEPSKDDAEICRLEKFLAQVEEYRAQKMTAQEIATKMGVTISTIRRNRLKLLELTNKKQIIQKGRDDE